MAVRARIANPAAARKTAAKKTARKSAKTVARPSTQTTLPLGTASVPAAPASVPAPPASSPALSGFSLAATPPGRAYGPAVPHPQDVADMKRHAADLRQKAKILRRGGNAAAAKAYEAQAKQADAAAKQAQAQITRALGRVTTTTTSAPRAPRKAAKTMAQGKKGTGKKGKGKKAKPEPKYLPKRLRATARQRGTRVNPRRRHSRRRNPGIPTALMAVAQGVGAAALAKVGASMLSKIVDPKVRALATVGATLAGGVALGTVAPVGAVIFASQMGYQAIAEVQRIASASGSAAPRLSGVYMPSGRQLSGVYTSAGRQIAGIGDVPSVARMEEVRRRELAGTLQNSAQTARLIAAIG